MVPKTMTYFVNNGTNEYGLLLDAHKAFDRLNQLFTEAFVLCK